MTETAALPPVPAGDIGPAALDDTVLGHALRRLLSAPDDDPVAAHDSTI